MHETEPLYFREFRKHFDNKIDSSINDLILTMTDTMITKEEFEEGLDEIRKDMATKEDIKNMATKEDIKNMATKEDIKNMATKEDMKGIHEHIGRYEVRAQNIEQILLQDHKPRIASLEQAFLTPKP